MRPHLELLQHLDVAPLVAQIEANSGLWNRLTIRQTYPGSAHADTKCIFIRGPLGFTPELYFNDLGSADYREEQCALPAVMELVDYVCSMLGVTELGRVLLVKLKAGGAITPHVDEGSYADHFSRLHVVLTTNDQCSNVTGGHFAYWECGSVWWFDHKLEHTAFNEGETDRIHMIVDVVMPDPRDSLSPQS